MISISIKSSRKLKNMIMLFLITFNLLILTVNNPVTAITEHITLEAILEYNDVNRRFDGYNLFVVEERNSLDWSNRNRTLLVTDMDGNIFFERLLGTTSVFVDYVAEFIDSRTIMYGEDNGIHLWNLDTDKTNTLDIEGHHDYEKNHIRDTYFSVFGYLGVIDNVSYIFDFIKETDIYGNTIWNIGTDKILTIDQWCPYEDMINEARDISHVNTLFYDEEDDSLYINVRNVNTFYKIDIETNDIVWALGKYGNFTLYDIDGQQRDSLFYHAHALEKINNNTFVLFDNDFHNETKATNHQSRLLEITIDEDKMQANVTWEWKASEQYYSEIWGDCNVLPNNNRLGVFGTHEHLNTDLGARLVEVDYKGDIVWEMSFPRQNESTIGVYEIQRLHFEPIVSEPVFIDKGEGNGYLEWEVRYNFNSNTEFEGKYHISVDGEDVVSDQIVFPRYWQSKKITYSTDLASLESHNIQLVVEDEAGHMSNSSNNFSPINKISLNRNTDNLSLSFGFSLVSITLIAITSSITRMRKREEKFL